MPDPTTCSVRTVTAPDGVDIPVPEGGLGLPDGSSVTIAADATFQINVKRDGDGNVVGYYVVVNSAPGSDEASSLFGELAQETAIARLEQMAGEIFATGATLALRAAGLIVGVLATLLTPSNLRRGRCSSAATWMRGTTRTARP